MSSKNVLPNQLDDQVYDSVKLKGGAIAVLILFLLGFFFLLHFPFQNTLKTLVVNALNSQSACPISYSKLETSLFLPKVIMEKPVIAGRCFGNPSTQLNFDDLKIGLFSPSLSPIGIRLFANLKNSKSKITAYPVISFNKMAIKIENTEIDGELLKKVNRNLNPIDGRFSVDALVKTEGRFVNNAKIVVKSKNLRVVSQKVQGFDIPSMTIGRLFFKSDLSNNSDLKIIALEIGGEAAPISAKVKGKIKLNQASPGRSKVDLMAEVKFSDEFLEKFPILNLAFDPKKKNANGYYNVKLFNTLGNLRHQIL